MKTFNFFFGFCIGQMLYSFLLQLCQISDSNIRRDVTIGIAKETCLRPIHKRKFHWSDHSIGWNQTKLLKLQSIKSRTEQLAYQETKAQ